MAFWINIHGCQPYPRHGHLCTKSAQKPKLLLATVMFSELFPFSTAGFGKMKVFSIDLIKSGKLTYSCSQFNSNSHLFAITRISVIDLGIFHQ